MISTADNLEDSQEEDLCQKFEKIYEQNKNVNLNRRLSSYFSSLPRISPVRSWSPGPGSVATDQRYQATHSQGSRYREIQEHNIRRHQSVPRQQESIHHHVPIRQKSVPIVLSDWSCSDDGSREEHCYTASRDQREKEVDVFKVWPERRWRARDKES